MHSRLIALVGTPNSGKTTLYNWITGSKHRTVNYPGATIEYSIGECLKSYTKNEENAVLQVMDTPGIYSLFPKSPEEFVTLGSLKGEATGIKPNQIIAVVDATQLGRNLLVVEQLKELNTPIVIALTMGDILTQQSTAVDVKQLSQLLNLPVVPVDGRTGAGVKDLIFAIENKNHIYKETVEKNKSNASLNLPEWSVDQIETTARRLLAIEGRVKQKNNTGIFTGSQSIDRWLLHPVCGILFFLFIMALFFTSIFWVASPVMQLVDSCFSWLGEVLITQLPASIWTDALSNGVVKSFGSVLIFAPQIFILFLGLVLLEDSGYLARAATLVDRPLSKIGLNGKSFIPILSGYACAIPAMMAARTVTNPKERKLTLFIIPLLSCSARLPVYALLVAFLFQDQKSWHAGLTMTAIYLASLILGTGTAALLNRFIPNNSKSLFMLELPLYRRPRFRIVLKSAISRTKHYLLKAGPVIFVLSLLIWAGTTFPHYKLENKTERITQSYAGQIGKWMEPVMEPMGSDWRVGLGLLSAFAAREVFVSSMAVIFSVTDDSKEDEEGGLQASLLAAMKSAKKENGQPLFTTASIVGLIVYFMIALQCLSTVSVSHRESGSLSFALIQMIAFNLAGYILAVLCVKTLS